MSDQHPQTDKLGVVQARHAWHRQRGLDGLSCPTAAMCEAFDAGFAAASAPFTGQHIDERTAMLLAAISVASLQNTRESAKERIGIDNPCWTQTYADVCAAVDREMAHREAAEASRSAGGNSLAGGNIPDAREAEVLALINTASDLENAEVARAVFDLACRHAREMDSARSATLRSPKELADLVIMDMQELPDRSSPDDWPKAMLVTAEEVRRLIEKHYESEAS